MRLIEMRARCERAAYARLAIALSCLVACLVAGCNAYDPTLVQGRTEQWQGAAGAGTGRATDGSRVQTGVSTRCEPGQTSCSLPNARAVCVNSQCLVVSCMAPYADCDDDAANGCEADLTSPAHCGLCNSACRFSHAQARCDEGRCSLGSCDTGYDNCDDSNGNGCEQKVDSVNDCGACGVRCDKPEHATAGCVAGACGVGTCDPGYGDCNGDAADGCEQPLDDRLHCGRCDGSCELPNTQASACVNAQCVVETCTAGFQDCNGAAADGCEADLAQASHCGGCGRDCDLPNTEAARCSVAQTEAQCQVDHEACGSGDVTEEECSGRLSTGCVAGHADCDDQPSNGCETDLSRLSSCGSCDNNCVQEHAVTECRDGRCVRMRCDPGYDTCDNDDRCQSLLDDVNNCGRCGNVCMGDSPRCSGGLCTDNECAALHADCDDGSNGCEQSLTTMDHCGGCGRRCESAPQAEMTCETASCAIRRCGEGFADCDKDPRNGCEVDLNSLDDCGECGKVCAFAHSAARCEAGRCERADCESGYANCNDDEADGCETNLLLPDNCGGCNNSCRALMDVAGSTCEASGCVVQCQLGRGNCDDDVSNGCESDLTAAQSCGRCGSDCTNLPHVTSAVCSETTCSQIECAAGYADCNGLAADGCERALNTSSDCGACDKPCAVAHAQGDCSTQTCQPGACDEGFADCDGDQKNGCETSLSDAAHCGSCSTACPSGNACVNGACGCSDDSQCATGTTCCEGRCLNTLGNCFPWPCIPTTQLPANALNCGGCGSICLGWCCSDLL